MAMHHPFTHRKRKIFRCWTLIQQLYVHTISVINGVEVGGGSIRITMRNTEDVRDSWIHSGEGRAQFGFLMRIPLSMVRLLGGLAYGLDR